MAIKKDQILKPNAKLDTRSIQLRIGEKIKKAREKRGLSQEELGDAVGMSRISVLQVEKGEANTTLPKLWLIACATGVQPTDLFPPIVKFKRHIVVPKSIRVGR